MQTEVLVVDSQKPEPAAIARTAGVLRRGGLVAFPTETVYGLGANALDAAAVERIFAAKGRPAENPLIVHVADETAARALVTDWPERAARLAARFWPGPLTLVLPRREVVPDVVTAGGMTVGIRVPSHPVALALIRAAGVPVAAPSANRSTNISPTRAEHVLKGLDGRIDMLLDGGPCPGGVESTVLDLTGESPAILRPGLVSPGEIASELALPVRIDVATEQGGPQRSPGRQARHYAPAVPLELADDDGWRRVQALSQQGARIGWLALELPSEAEFGRVNAVFMPRDPASYAAALYAQLHALEDAGVERIVVACPPEDEAWLAVRDRLRRAAHPD